MPRSVAFQLPVDTSHFTPLQLQAAALLSLSFNAFALWLKEHLVSFPQMIRSHSQSVVIMGASLHYDEPLGFFDGDALDVTASLRAMRGGSRAELQTDFSGGRVHAARSRVIFCPVHVIEQVGLSAQPGSFAGEVLNRFRPDEMETASPSRPLPDLRHRYEQMESFAESTSDFVVHRRFCEVADQWAFTEVPSLVGAARESLAMNLSGTHPELRDGVSKPLRHFDMELYRPYFWLQPGKVATKAYRDDGRLVLVHKLLSPVGGDELHGVVIERF